MAESLPPLPPLDLARVLAVKSRLYDAVFFPRLAVELAGDEFADLVAACARYLSTSSREVSRGVVEDSARSLAGRILTPAAAGELAWRLAGNLGRLRDGLPAPPWARQTAPEWTPVQIVGARYAIQKKPTEKFGKSGLSLRFRFLAGTPCPLVTEDFWSNPKCDLVAYSAGFRRRPPYFKADQSELMGLRLAVLVEPRLSQRGPRFFHVQCPPSLLDYNVGLVKKRRRIGFACPENFPHPCHQCWVGAESCPAATHRSDYVVGSCPACGRADAVFDTDDRYVNDNCLRCQPRVAAGIPVKKEDPHDPGPEGGGHVPP